MRITKSMAVTTILPAFVLMPAFTASSVAAQEATPTMTYSCEAVAASPIAGIEGTGMGTPMTEDGHEVAGQNVEFDQLYIDMMLPHHESIIALAQAAEERLTDERLQTVAENIISAQSAENEELRGYREQWHGSADPMPMDESMMTEVIPMMGDMASMQRQMDPQALITAFCAGEDPNLTFIELVIPHHEMAIQASETARDQATHEELRAIAERVVQDQQAEIDELETIRAELTGEGTPAAS